jgi:hypothetical protein
MINSVLEGARPDSLIAGAVFDFAGYMTTRDKTIPIGASADAAPVATHIKQWAAKRSLDIDNADVQKWNEAIKRVVNGESPSDVLDEITKTSMIATYPKPMGIVRDPRYDRYSKKRNNNEREQ